MTSFLRLLPLTLAGSALPIAAWSAVRLEVAPSGFIRSVWIGEHQALGGIGVYLPKPGWKGTFAELGAGPSGKGQAPPAKPPYAGEGTLSGPAGPAPVDYTWSIRTEGDSVHVDYAITPRQAIDVAAVLIRLHLDLATHKGTSWSVVRDGSLRSGVFPQTFREPYSFFSDREFDWLGWELGGGVLSSLTPDWETISHVTMQDNRKFGAEGFEIQLYAPAKGRLPAGKTIRLAFTLRARDRAETTALEEARRRRQTILRASLAQDRPAAIGAVSSSAERVPAYSRFELAVDVKATYSNPFDPEDIALDGHFVTPSGKEEVVPGFLWWGYKRSRVNGVEHLVADGRAGWRIRYCPREPGTHRYWVTLRDGAEHRRSAEGTFTCTASDYPGMVRISPDNPLYFEYDNRQPYFAIGENVCWPGKGGTYDYDMYWKNLADHGANYARLWIGPFDCFTLERKANGPEDQAGLGRIDLAGAWRIDYVLDLAERRGIRVMFCIDSFNSLRIRPSYPRWAENPYNAANGGPLQKPREFFTNPEAKALFKRRLRYIVARWGWQPTVLSWEFWNEVNIIETYISKDSVAWHREMARYVRGIDPFRHLITTSWAGVGGDPAVDALPEMEYIQSHQYGARDCAAFMGRICREKAARFGKPHYFGEFGTGTRAEGTHEDTEGIHLHNGLWSGLLNHAAGTGMLWWWDNYVQPRNLYFQFDGISRFAKGIPLNTRSFKPVEVRSIAYREPAPPPRVEDLELLPTAASWKPAPFNRANTFVVHADGRVEHAENMSKVLHGTRNHPALHNPATFLVDAPEDTEFVVHVDGVSGYGGSGLKILLDDTEVLRQDFSDNDKGTETIHRFDGAYRVPLSRGKHRIVVTNEGNDWIYVRYQLPKYRVLTEPPVDAYLMMDESAEPGGLAAILWVKHKHYTWFRHNQGKSVVPAAPTTVTLPVPAPGPYQVERWNTITGEPGPKQRLVADNGSLAVPVPELATDVAYKIYRDGK